MGEVEDPKPAEFQPKKWPQLLAAGIATNGAFALGAVLAWPSPSIPELIESKVLGELTGSQTSWIASLAVLGAACSAIPAGYAMERIGRRQSMMVLSIPLFLGWMIVAFADSIRMMYLGRFITGFSAGAFSLLVPTYLSEIASDKYRGQIGSLFTTQTVHGILFVYLHAIIVDWVSLSLASSMSALVILIGMYFMPESPIHLLNEGRDKEAAESLKWLRRAKELEQIEPELKMLQNNVKVLKSSGEVDFRSMGRSIWHPLGICIAFMIFQEWSGLLIAVSYTAEIFKTAGSALSPNVSAIIVGVAQMIGVGISGALIDRLGRKVLLIGSSLLVVIFWVPLGVAFKLQEQNNGVMPKEIQILPLICLVGYITVFSLGLGPIPWMLPSELLPANVRGRLGAVALTLNWLPAFVLVKVYDDLAGALGTYSVFWIFAGISLKAAIFTYFFLPETKGKSQEEIREFFQPELSFPSKFSTNM